ncbi:MAG: hypothetical protein AAGK22_20845 [Acidobacteriota bacterium]
MLHAVSDRSAFTPTTRSTDASAFAVRLFGLVLVLAFERPDGRLRMSLRLGRLRRRLSGLP